MAAGVATTMEAAATAEVGTIVILVAIVAVAVPLAEVVAVVVLASAMEPAAAAVIVTAMVERAAMEATTWLAIDRQHELVLCDQQYQPAEKSIRQQRKLALHEMDQMQNFYRTCCESIHLLLYNRLREIAAPFLHGRRVY
ncbi:hypothetical protein FACS189449_05780 [Alphaproteobacteria bacterium]|nr:hypothetical protein FACS189449_05780 [Alphaproteobacteria bacterium]